MVKNCTISSVRNTDLRKNNKIGKLFLSILLMASSLSFSSCETMEHWLFDASDYSVFHSKNDAETEMDRMDQYWDDLDYDIWYEENEYD